MTATLNDLDSQSPLKAGDPNLALLALQAADEIDALLSGSSKGTVAISMLAARLRHSTENVAGSSGRRNLMEPQALQLLGDTYYEAHGRAVETIDELAAEAWSTANEFNSAQTEGENETLTKLRAFCLTLSRIATANRRSALDMRNRTPFRS